MDARVEKRFYVSPFFTVEGQYRVRAGLTDSNVFVAIELSQGGQTVFEASVVGRLGSPRPASIARAMLRDPVPGLRVAFLIRFHGIRLWLARLPVIPHRPVSKGLTRG